jgi:phage terminase small subunit
MPARKVSSIEKKRRGTSQPCREPEAPELDLAPLEHVPEPPEWMEIHARKYWKKIAPVLVSKRVLAEAHLGALTMLCVCQGSFEKSAQAGFGCTASDLAQLRLLHAEFGLTPASQARVSQGEARKPGNRFGGRGKKTS